MEHNLKNGHQIFRVDKFKVPAVARDQFLERAHATRQLLRTIPGFIADLFLEQSGQTGDLSFVTIVVWRDLLAFDSAQATVQRHYRKLGFNPGEMLNRLGIEADLAAYTELKS